MQILTTKEKIWELLRTVNDPEVPVLSVTDLGIVRDVNMVNSDIEIVITPTYSGCPAMDMISATIKMTMLEAGFRNVMIKTVLSPAWTTEWMTEAGKEKLKKYGIAPPNANQQVCEPVLFEKEEVVQCPNCDSYHTRRVSEFGSTACKALFTCNDCREPFEYFKCH